MSAAVQYIDTSPPTHRTRLVVPGQGLGMTAASVYSVRPSSLSHVSLYDYFRHYQLIPVSGKKRPKKLPKQDLFSGITMDLKNHVYRRTDPALVRFSSAHPAHNPESFFYNVLLQHVPFRHEAELLSIQNRMGTWREECRVRGIITSEEELDEHLKW